MKTINAALVFHFTEHNFSRMHDPHVDYSKGSGLELYTSMVRDGYRESEPLIVRELKGNLPADFPWKSAKECVEAGMKERKETLESLRATPEAATAFLTVYGDGVNLTEVKVSDGPVLVVDGHQRIGVLPKAVLARMSPGEFNEHLHIGTPDEEFDGDLVPLGKTDDIVNVTISAVEVKSWKDFQLLNLGGNRTHAQSLPTLEDNLCMARAMMTEWSPVARQTDLLKHFGRTIGRQLYYAILIDAEVPSMKLLERALQPKTVKDGEGKDVKNPSHLPFSRLNHQILSVIYKSLDKDRVEKENLKASRKGDKALKLVTKTEATSWVDDLATGVSKTLTTSDINDFNTAVNNRNEFAREVLKMVGAVKGETVDTRKQLIADTADGFNKVYDLFLNDRDAYDTLIASM